ncbi:MAG TPA: penicillin-binding protein activator [Kofleriaceae bacterium]|jgi:ABC-type branched-subunit amino acid transport system substrate-binding protein
MPLDHETHATAEHAPAGQAAIGDPDAMDEAAVTAALARVGDRAPAAALALRAARLAHHRGDDAEARADLARAANADDEPRVHDALGRLAAEVAAPPVDPATIAVLLPLSGRFASVGAELRAAIELAPPDGASWLFLDTRGEPDAAIAAVDTAFARGAIGVLGPAGTREAIAAAREAALRQLPIALLAPDDGADPDAGVFRLVGSPADEGRAIARLAADESFPTVAVLAPRDDVGAEAAAAFVAEAGRLGLSVTAQGTYDPTGGDLEPDVKQFLGLVPATNPRLAEHLRRDPKHGFQTFSPDIPFSLLYVPDRYDRAALVAAFLPYFNVELRTTDFPDPAMLARKHGGRMPQVVQLVGGAGWRNPSLPLRGGSAVQGALVVDAFAGDAGGDEAVAFGAAFQRATGRAPSDVAAEAYDAAALVAAARAAAAGSPDPRAAFRSALARARLDDGACGAAALDLTGEVARTPSVLQISGDELTSAR